MALVLLLLPLAAVRLWVWRPGRRGDPAPEGDVDDMALHDMVNPEHPVGDPERQ